MRRGGARNHATALAAGLGILLPPALAAAPNEIKVFTDELAGYGEHTLETHLNKASRAGARAADPATPLQLMPEYSYGLWKNWELSVQLPLAWEQGALRSSGYRAELQYVAPHDDAKGAYWGINFELASVQQSGRAHFWNAELIPIFGWRSGRWHLAANPGVHLPLTGPARKINFEPAAKIAYRASGRNYVGIEYFADVTERTRMLYFAWDGKIGNSDINLGLGRGLTDASDRWVLKLIYEFPF
jgi:hypothetical protein